MRNLLDRIHPTFAKGGRFERYYPLYEALDTFLYSPSDVTRRGSHVRDGMNLKRMMSLVVLALLPCFFMAFHNTGYQANLAITQVEGVTPLTNWRESLFQFFGLEHDPENFFSNFVLGGLYFIPTYVITIVVGGAWETLFAIVRKHDINEGFLVTSALFPLTLPPSIPLWQVALGITFGVVIGKEIYGGTGMNFLNPALVARAFLYFAYPAEISGDAVWTAADGVTSATPLGAMAVADVGQSIPELNDYTYWEAFLGYMQGSMGETSTLACLIGAAFLIAVGIGSWRIMTGVVLGALATSLIFYGFALGGYATNPLMHMNPMWHFVIGGFAFGTVYMATDPVSAAMTNTGRWWYGGLIGAMTVLIRVINPAYPEGIMLAILFGNTMAPLIDYFVVQANIKRRMARYAA